MACTSKFNLFKRRHHCRKCGFVVCDACSQDRLKIPELSTSEPKGSRVCTSCSHQHYLDNKRKVEAIKDADPNSIETLLEKWKTVTKSANTKAVDGLSKDQLKETIGNACAKIMEDICAGIAFPASHPIVEVKVQHFNFLGVSRSWNRVHLTGTKYNIGWVFYRDYTKCMVCTADFMNAAKPMTRTHCRMCGYMTCSQCASHKILIDEFLETNGSDCCMTCYEFLKPKEAELEAEQQQQQQQQQSDPTDDAVDKIASSEVATGNPPNETATATASELTDSPVSSSSAAAQGGVSPTPKKKVDKNQAMIDKLSKLNANFN